MKKIFISILMIVAAACVLAACNGETTTSTINITSTEENRTTAEPVKTTTTEKIVTTTTAPQPKKWDVVFNTGGAVITPQSILDGETATKPANPTATGKQFVGWYTDNSYTTLYNFSTPITKDITIYARWMEVFDGEKLLITLLGGHSIVDGKLKLRYRISNISEFRINKFINLSLTVYNGATVVANSNFADLILVVY